MPCGLAEEETRLVGEIRYPANLTSVLSTVPNIPEACCRSMSHTRFSRTKFVPRPIFGENCFCSPTFFRVKCPVWRGFRGFGAEHFFCFRRPRKRQWINVCRCEPDETCGKSPGHAYQLRMKPRTPLLEHSLAQASSFLPPSSPSLAARRAANPTRQKLLVAAYPSKRWIWIAHWSRRRSAQL